MHSELVLKLRFNVRLPLFCTSCLIGMKTVIAKVFVCKQWRVFEFDSGWQRSVEHPFEAIERGKKFYMPSKRDRLRHCDLLYTRFNVSMESNLTPNPRSSEIFSFIYCIVNALFRWIWFQSNSIFHNPVVCVFWLVLHYQGKRKRRNLLCCNSIEINYRKLEMTIKLWGRPREEIVAIIVFSKSFEEEVF